MSDHIMHVTIVTPQATAFAGAALAVTIPGSKGTFQVLYNHAPIISSLDVGIIKVEDPGNKVTYYASRGGFVEVLKNNVSIIVNELVEASGIDTARTEADLEATKNDEGADRHQREAARKEQHWHEAKLRAARLQREGV
jgi:F-type H+-transporting ATPase subunit epsilon